VKLLAQGPSAALRSGRDDIPELRSGRDDIRSGRDDIRSGRDDIREASLRLTGEDARHYIGDSRH
jgi:hypothetical protein